MTYAMTQLIPVIVNVLNIFRFASGEVIIAVALGSTPAGGELLIHVTKRVLGLRAQDIPSRVKSVRCLTGPRE
ncbi:hypothetical protein F2Q69_00015031 [Brassica cretica]|uniref:Uncharacterized protein n=1 Tax=Brassica cretica TaxID=69181 RepID=A0A8S9QPT2_BRACR|nr:hypothetical protein F2Q69_00015031 [Brassica cretica]